MIKDKLNQLALLYPWYGFNKLLNLLRLQGIKFNHKRVYRNYCELKLNLRRRPKKRLAPRTAVTLEQPAAINFCWSLDFMSDALSHGRRFRTLNVIDDASRECVALLAAWALPATRVTDYLDRMAARRGYPSKIRVDNGPENVSRHFQNWANKHGIVVEYIQPGKPAQNAYIERFNRSYREAVLDAYLFESIAHVQLLTDAWIQHYNQERPHEALNNQTPQQYAEKLMQINSTKALG